MIKSFISILFLSVVFFACIPKEEIQFKGVSNIKVEAGEAGEPALTADAYFYNPNKMRMKLKEISVDVLVNNKKSAAIRQNMKLIIPAQADFQVPLKAQLHLKELGLLDTIVNLLGGKKYEVRYVGFIRAAVNGVTVKVPVDYKDEIRLRF